jgi:hypothetical protein
LIYLIYLIERASEWLMLEEGVCGGWFWFGVE